MNDRDAVVLAFAETFVRRGVQYTSLADLRAAIPKEHAAEAALYPCVRDAATAVHREAFGNFPFLPTPAEQQTHSDGLHRIVTLARRVAHRMSTDTVIHAALLIVRDQDRLGLHIPEPTARWETAVARALEGFTDRPRTHAEVLVSSFAGVKSMLLARGRIGELGAHCDLILHGFLSVLGADPKEYL